MCSSSASALEDVTLAARRVQYGAVRVMWLYAPIHAAHTCTTKQHNQSFDYARYCLAALGLRLDSRERPAVRSVHAPT